MSKPVTVGEAVTSPLKTVLAGRRSSAGALRPALSDRRSPAGARAAVEPEPSLCIM